MLKNMSKQCVFSPNFDRKIDSGIFAPNSGLFVYEMADECPPGPGNSAQSQ